MGFGLVIRALAAVDRELGQWRIPEWRSTPFFFLGKGEGYVVCDSDDYWERAGIG